MKVTQQRKFSWSCTHCHSFYKKSAATQHYCQRRLVLSLLSFLLQKECCNTTLLPRGQRRLVLSLLSFLLQNGKAKPVFEKSSTTKTWVSKIQKVPWTLMVSVGLSQRFKNRFNIMISINDIEKTVKVTQQRKFSSILFSVDALLTSDSSNLVPK